MFPFIGGLNGDGFFNEEYGDDYGESENYYIKPAIRPVTCGICGFQNLKWLETSHGWRMTYSTGLLAGKIHSCGSNI